jgi:hypothetical protein
LTGRRIANGIARLPDGFAAKVALRVALRRKASEIEG